MTEPTPHPLAEVMALTDSMLANNQGLLLCAADPELRLRLEENIKVVRAQLAPMRILVAKMERVDRMVTKALRKVKPRIVA